MFVVHYFIMSVFLYQVSPMYKFLFLFFPPVSSFTRPLPPVSNSLDVTRFYADAFGYKLCERYRHFNVRTIANRKLAI